MHAAVAFDQIVDEGGIEGLQYNAPTAAAAIMEVIAPQQRIGTAASVEVGEAKAAVGAKEAGIVVDLWKAVGDRRVIAIVNVESMEMLDQILLDLPIMKRMGQHVKVDVTALRTYEGFAADVNERLTK